MNIRHRSIAWSFAALLIFAPWTKASAAMPPSPATEASEGSDKALLKEGTELKLKLDGKLNSKKAAEGDPVNLSLEQDLRVGEKSVAKAGTAAIGTVSRASKSRAFGKPGDLSLELNYLRIGDTKVRLRGVKGKQGRGRELQAIVLAAFFGPIGLIRHGRNAELKEGTVVVAYVDRDTELAAISE